MGCRILLPDGADTIHFMSPKEILDKERTCFKRAKEQEHMLPPVHVEHWEQ